MHNHSHVSQRYSRTDIETLSDEAIILKIYSRLIFLCEETKRAMKEDDFQTQNRHIAKLKEGLRLLDQSLTYDVNRPLALEIHALYEAYSHKLVYANAAKSMGAVDNVASGLCILRDAWTDVAQQVRSA